MSVSGDVDVCTEGPLQEIMLRIMREHSARTGSLRLVTQAGFGPELREYLPAVDDGAPACGQAARQSTQNAIAHVWTDPGFAPHRAKITPSLN